MYKRNVDVVLTRGGAIYWSVRWRVELEAVNRVIAATSAHRRMLGRGNHGDYPQHVIQIAASARESLEHA